ncbi:hypothetical protein KY289_009947 [Solanum tuberosum]|nr:hypothetical protein KY289_009947 [Solanum tuberosum]
MMAQFFWSSCIGGRGRQWTKWSNLCLPEKEGGFGFRLMQDLAMALFCKLWWNFRTKPSIWREYMENKYCRKTHVTEIMWKPGGGGSQVWKKMLQARDLIEHQILWKMERGSVSVWHDNWTGLGDLYTITREEFQCDDTYKTVRDLTRQGEWDTEVLHEILPQELVNHILQNIHPPKEEATMDKPCWMPETRGSFSVKSAWHYIRHKAEENKIYKWMWSKGVPFKMAFIMWRLWKFKIPVDDIMRRWGLEGPSKCWCCERPQHETLAHVFLKSDSANRTWSYFCSFAGLNIEGLQLREVIVLWWGTKIGTNMRPFYRALPSFTIWELWRKRNRMKHEGKQTSVARVIHNITRNMYMLVRLRKPFMTCPVNWPDMLLEWTSYKPKMKVKRVLWEFPPNGWVKYNTDGASRGNPGLSSYAFVLRNAKGDVEYVERASIENTTNTVAEAKAILEASKHCKKSQHNQIIIQTDSMLLYKVLEKKWACPWIIAEMVTEIQSCLQDKQVIFQHILREGNKLADHVANFVID